LTNPYILPKSDDTITARVRYNLVLAEHLLSAACAPLTVESICNSTRMKARVGSPGKGDDVISFSRQEQDNLNKLVNEVEEMIPLSHSSDNLMSQDTRRTDDWWSTTLLCGEIVPYLQTTMMGAMLLIRLPWIIANGGILLTIVLIVISMLVVGMTSLALGAIGSDGKITRFSTLFALLDKNLGRELSSSICLVYSAGKFLSVSMYCLTAAEAALWRRGDYLLYQPYSYERIVGAIAICGCLFVVCLVARKAAITATGIASLIVALLVYLSIVVGMIVNFSNGGSHSEFISSGGPNVVEKSRQYHLYTLLGVIFPNFVGILANLIRPEKLPQRQMPRPLGNILGISLTGAFCIVITGTYGFYVSNSELGSNKFILGQ
jgi:hypothetical protein